VQSSQADAASLSVTAEAKNATAGQSVKIQIQTRPARLLARAKRLTVTASAGTVAASGSVGRYAFVAPQIIEPLTVVVRVTARLRGRLFRAMTTIAVAPKPFKIVSRDTFGSFGLRIPKMLILGTVKDAEISIANVTPRPELFVSRGSLGPLRRVGNRLVARYTPPSKTYPQLAIVAVLSGDRRKLDWATIPLWGKARMWLKGEPFANVTVLAGKLKFGPVRTGRKGKGALHIAAPPGARSLKTVASDALGNRKHGKLALHPPPLERVAVICPKASTSIIALAVDPFGKPASGRKLVFNVDRGSAVPVPSARPGIYIANYTSDQPRTATEPISIKVSDAAGTAKCVGLVPSLPPTAVTVALDKKQLVAGGKPMKVMIGLTYTKHLPPRSIPIQLRVSVGTVTRARRVGSKEFVASWTIPNRFLGKTSATLTARAGRVVARQAVRLVAAAGVRLRARLSASVLTANGKDSTVIVVRVVDSFGNPASADLRATAKGTIGPFERERAGHYTARYTAPTFGKRDTVSVAIANQPPTVLSMTLIESSRWAVGGQVGYITNLGRVGAPIGSFTAEYSLPVLQRRLHIGPYVGFYTHSSQFTDSVMAEQVQLSVRAVPLLARIAYHRRIGRFISFVGVAGGAVWLRTEVESPSAGRIIDKGPRPAASGFVGVMMPTGPGNLRFELGYLYATVGGTSARGHVGGPLIQLGYRYSL